VLSRVQGGFPHGRLAGRRKRDSSFDKGVFASDRFSPADHSPVCQRVPGWTTPLSSLSAKAMGNRCIRFKNPSARLQEVCSNGAFFFAARKVDIKRIQCIIKERVSRSGTWSLKSQWNCHGDLMIRTQKRVLEMLDKLKERRFRITPQRLAVIEVLASGKGHPSVEQVYERVKSRFPTTSLATIYKTITLLKEMNEVLELGFPDGSNRYDGAKPYPHPHIICTRCKKILDPDLHRLTDLTEEVTHRTGFKVLFHRLDFFGLCPECQGTG